MTLSNLLAYRVECMEAISAVDLVAVAGVADALQAARHAGQTVFIAENGGRAATASHMATDLMLGSQLVDPPLRVVALTDNQAVITATGNDLDSTQIFARPLSRLARSGDLLILVSASGNSPKILACVDVAKALTLSTIGFTGFDGGKLATVVDLLILVPTRKGAYGPVEDAHLAINHMLTEQLKGDAK